MNTSALLHNISTAVQDPDLYGDSLIIPFKKCYQAYQYTISPLRGGIGQKVADVATRAFTSAVASLAVIPSIALAGAGAVVKWGDLYRRFDKKAAAQSEIGTHMPFVLDQFSRLGDRNAAYLNTRIVADESGLPLYFKPHKGCEMFAFDKMETNRGPRYYREVVHLKTPGDIQALARGGSTLHLLPYFPHTRDLSKEGTDCSLIKHTINWGSHKQRVRGLLEVQGPVDQIQIPEDSYSIALHIRDGGDVDDNNTKTLHPLKLPCMDFYLGELGKVLRAKRDEGESRFFVHIFTDALQPIDVREKVWAKVTELGLAGYVQLSFTPKERVSLKDDVGNMHRFTCMIRADSNLSGPVVNASNVTEVDIYPAGFSIDAESNEISITEVKRGMGDRVISDSTQYSKQMKGWLPMCFNELFYRYYGVYKTSTDN